MSFDSEPVPLDISDQFAHWATIVRNWKKPSDDDFVLMYGLYKQATAGDCETDATTNGLEGKKHAAWKSHNQITKESAMELYIEKAKQLTPKYE